LFDRWPRIFRRSPRTRLASDGPTVALVADELTRSCLQHECRVVDVGPTGGRSVLRAERPDLLFVESAWSGHRNRWKYRIAAYPDHPERSNAALAELVACARDLGIPAVFWNKEDGVHFERFIGSARLFDAIFTVDATCIPRYQEVVGPTVQVAALPFAVQPAIHHFDGIDPRRRSACFVGSYSRHIHDERRARQDMLMETAAQALGLDVYDRNSDRRSAHYRYPGMAGMRSHPKVPHEGTAAVYKTHLASLNVNTVEDSPTMYSRRLIEILACGGLAVTTPARSVDALFRDYCHVVRSREEARALFERLAREGYSARDREMMAEGAAYVLREHTYARRLETVFAAARSAAGANRLQAVPDA
jgi:hypothetical protein